tara:strand:+ start:14418 stop:14942 length:525 start_codon:yes stop_codon:yes gene_type:complete
MSAIQKTAAVCDGADDIDFKMPQHFKMDCDGTDTATFKMPQGVRSSRHGLRQLPVATIDAIMNKLDLPLHGTKVDKVQTLSNYLQAQRQQKASPSTTYHPHDAVAEGEINEAATNPFVCMADGFPWYGDAIDLHDVNVVTVRDAKESAHLDFIPFGYWDWNQHDIAHCEPFTHF